MVTNIIQIGNSKGIILPSEILKQLRLSLKSAVSISLDGNNIVIKAQPRQGWAEAAKEMLTADFKDKRNCFNTSEGSIIPLLFPI